jgi:addiction module RelE/StbE family toxin
MKGNPPQVNYSKNFLKQLKKSPIKIQQTFRDRLVIFIENPINHLLNNHALTGKYTGCRSINITGDWRAIYQDFSKKNTKIYYFVTIGTHNQLYR